MVFTSLYSHWNLIRLLTGREIASRYRGSLLGVLWSLAHPIMMLVVYAFVFRVVFKASWSHGGEGNSEFVMTLFTGLIVCAVFNECVNRAPTLILNHVSYVKKIVFPLEILPWVSLGEAFLNMGVSITVLLVFHIVCARRFVVSSLSRGVRARCGTCHYHRHQSHAISCPCVLSAFFASRCLSSVYVSESTHIRRGAIAECIDYGKNAFVALGSDLLSV